jgi:hypothetical protein
MYPQVLGPVRIREALPPALGKETFERSPSKVADVVAEDQLLPFRRVAQELGHQADGLGTLSLEDRLPAFQALLSAQ